MLPKRLFIVALLCTLLCQLQGQTNYSTWLRGSFTVPDSRNRSCASADDQQVFAGDQVINGDRQISLTKVDVNGFVKWSYSYGDPGDDFCGNVCLANNGGFIVAGTTKAYSNGIEDLFVLKTDSVGNVIWFRTFGNGFQHSPRTVTQAPNGNICVAGSYNPWLYAGQPMAATILVLDNAGNLVSFQSVNLSRNYPIYMDAKPSPSGGFILTGGDGHVWDYIGVLMTETDAAGNILWLRSYRSTTPSGTFNLWAAGSRTCANGYNIEVTPNGYLVGGYISDHDQYGTNWTFYDGLMMEFDFLGNVVWTGRYPNAAGTASAVFDVAITTGGNYTGAGFSNSGADPFQYMLQPNGTLTSARHFGTGSSDHFYSVCTTTGGDLLLSGKTNANGPDVPFLVRTDVNGTSNTCQNTPVNITPSQPVFTLLNPTYAITNVINPLTHVIAKQCACVKTEFFCPAPPPPVDFTFTTACALAPVPFDNISEVYLYCPPTIVWDFGDGNTYTGWDTSHVYSDTGNYVVTLYIIDCFNDTLTAQHTVTIGSAFNVDLGADTTLCNSGAITLDAGSSGGTYTWNTGQNSQTISVNSGGTYSVLVSDGLCSATDTIQVTMLTSPDLGGLIANCAGNEIILNAGPFWGTYTWSTGDSTETISISDAGTYWVTVSNGACTETDTVDIVGGIGEGALYFPNAFTPNKDGTNEIFTGVGNNITTFHLDIWNRWGELIYTTEDLSAGWDGYYKGKVVQNDIYVYVVTYTSSCTGNAIQRRIGHVWAGN